MLPDSLGKQARSHNRRSFNFSGSLSGVAISDADVARFEAKIERSDGCWLWRGSINKQTGYGSLWLGGVPQYAHRFAWALSHGEPVPAGQFVLHTCDVPACVNPAHLFLGTHKLNMEDAARKGRLHVPRPTRQRLTDEQVDRIVARAAAGEKQCALAREYGVTETWVSLLVNGKRRQYRRSA